MSNIEKDQLVKLLRGRKATIGIVGLGYVGLPLSLSYCNNGYDVVGLDVDRTKVDSLNNGQSYIAHIPASQIQRVQDKFVATTDFSKAQELDALIICVPTPLDKFREPDLTFVIDTLEALLPHLRSGQVISLESTTYPGTTDEELKPRIEKMGLTVGQDIFLVYSPEREDPGNANFSTSTIPKVCGGSTSDCLEVGVTLYEQVISKVVPVSSTKAAELTKLLENIHRAVNIGLVNEMKVIADRMGIDIYEVINAAATKPFGFVPYYPGPGLGGHCIPIDPFYLTWKAREYGLHTRFIELAGEINNSMPDFVMSKLAEALNERQMAINGTKVLMLGIAYKKNVDDMRESPSVILMEKLRDAGAKIDYSDPSWPSFPKMREHHFVLNSVELTEETIKSYDVVLIGTNHDCFDYDLLQKHAKIIIDTRGVYSEKSDNIIKA